MRASVVVGGDALLVKVSVPVAAPLACGLNVTVKSAVCPAWIVTGREIPLSVNRELLLLALLMVTFAPAAASVPVAVPVAPTATFPRLKVVGVTLSCAVAAVPVPVRLATTEEGFAFDTKVSVALAAPAACGLNVKVNGAEWPASMRSGMDKPLNANREFELVAEVTVTFAFAATRFPDNVSLVPTVTLPKENDEG